MTSLQFCPIHGRLDEMSVTLMNTGEVLSRPVLSYSLRCEEIIVNIINYAYRSKTEAYINLYLRDEGDAISIEFRDGGIPFNSLKCGQPDITLSPEQRNIGGLGILLVLKMVDEVDYIYTEHENCLIIRKR